MVSIYKGNESNCVMNFSATKHPSEMWSKSRWSNILETIQVVGDSPSEPIEHTYKRFAGILSRHRVFDQILGSKAVENRDFRPVALRSGLKSRWSNMYGMSHAVESTSREPIATLLSGFAGTLCLIGDMAQFRFPVHSQMSWVESWVDSDDSCVHSHWF